MSVSPVSYRRQALLDIVRVLGDGALEKAQNQRTGKAHFAASDLGVRGKAHCQDGKVELLGELLALGQHVAYLIADIHC